MQVYKITNLINGKLYIGITNNYKKRLQTYKSMSKSDKNYRHRIVYAMKKYGFNNFKFEILLETDQKSILKEKEVEFISKFNTTDVTVGYNISLGGDFPSLETREKWSKTRKGRKLSDSHKKAIAKGLKGHKVSDKVRDVARVNAKNMTGWNRGTKGLMKANSGSFGNGRTAPNKGRKKFIIDGKIRYLKIGVLE